MSKKLSTIWSLDPHTQAKHAILKNYLNAWLPAITRWNKRVLYLDGFAGPGKYIGGEDGSPIIALKTAINHKANWFKEIVFVFIEFDKDRCTHLEQSLVQLKIPKNFRIEVIHAKFDETVDKMLTYLEEQNKQLAPTFAFIDPFGFSHTPFCIVERMLKNDKCEVFINFMYEEINRFISHPDHEDNFDILFGTQQWRKARNLAVPAERRRLLHDVYMKELKKNAEYVRSFEMKNQRNATDYFLFFATNSYDGLKKMKAAMWSVDQTGSFTFSDYTNPDQLVLFDQEIDFTNLKNTIVRQFRGLECSIEDIERFVVVETPYRETHFKNQILKPMEAANELVYIKGNRKRKGTYPEGSVLKIL